MKNRYWQKIYVFLFTMLTLAGCKEDFIGQYATDNIPPAPISNVVVSAVPGGVDISYDLPKESDLLYVKAVYTNLVGETYEEKASAFNDEMKLRGFGKSQDVEITLYAVDKSMNLSEPVKISVVTLDANIYRIAEMMQVEETWGGLKLEWENELAEQLVVSVKMKEKEVARFYSKDMFARYYVRGLEPVKEDFTITVRDIYGNITEPREVKGLTPWYEIELPTETFKCIGQMPYIQLPAHLKLESMSSSAPQWIFSPERQVEVVITDFNKYNPYEDEAWDPYHPFDMGAEYVLSRMQMWGREGFEYRLRNYCHIEIWGTSDNRIGQGDPASWEGWEKIAEFKSTRPSGTDFTVVPTADDISYYKVNGDNFEFPILKEKKSVRYVRVRGKSNWSGTNTAIAIGYIRLWGQDIQ